MGAAFVGQEGKKKNSVHSNCLQGVFVRKELCGVSGRTMSEG
jgi:hypothetical protein